MIGTVVLTGMSVSEVAYPNNQNGIQHFQTLTYEVRFMLGLRGVYTVVLMARVDFGLCLQEYYGQSIAPKL